MTPLVSFVPWMAGFEGKSGDDNGMQVPKNVYNGLEAVRQSGKTNMLIVSEVRRCAVIMGYLETAEWIDHHRDKYWIGIFQGFTPS